MKFRVDQPYNRLPPLPPKAELETKAVLKKCISARTALAELKLAGSLIPNASMLINTLPLLEAQASSEIENIVTTTDSLFEYSGLGEEHADPAIKEALRYKYAGGLQRFIMAQSLNQPIGKTHYNQFGRVNRRDTRLLWHFTQPPSLLAIIFGS